MTKRNKIKESIIALLLALGLFMAMAPFAFATDPPAKAGAPAKPQSALTLPPVGSYNGMVQDPGPVGSFDSGFASLAVGVVLNIRYLLLALAIAMLIFAGVGLVMAQGNDEAWKKAKSALIFSIVGLTLVGFSGEIVRIFAVGRCAELGMLPSANNASCSPGGFLANPQTIIQRTTLFNKDVQYIITFIKYLIGSVAVVMTARNAIRMVANSAGDELVKDKKNLIATSIGLIAIIVADPIINNVFFVIDKTRYPGTGGAVVGISYTQGISEIIGFTNFIITIMTPLAILLILVGGIMYMTAAGVPEAQGKAKKMVTMALVALVVIYGAFAVVSTFITGQFNVGASTVNPAAVVEGITSTTNVATP